ncbi:hypothetical protein [Chryseobacterium sp. MFBS3-17]|uniref:hypothetical protein n=1 Tax=Chryseobacterium sp. MFBS3-17 TaxID=2886689 RepID=UPI001D0E5D96|nr:hypothetical protein [Chryseobacterium sp. MFBS3-17]MCC2590224.1 hypothetical protein [Chryseobacterium sp. MFBS3-17]
MKTSVKIILTLTTALFSTGLSAQFSSSENPDKVKSKGYTKTANPFTHYLYKKGFRNYDVVKNENKTDGKTTAYHELRFHSVYHQNYTQKLMYDQFGLWHKEINTETKAPALVWRDVKLFRDSPETFRVFAQGERSFRHMYASVYVFDSQEKDCLAEDHPLRDRIIQYFSDKIWNLSDSNAFAEAYNNTEIRKIIQTK